MLQAKQLGKFLAVGVHSDEEILENKGPTVMNLKERYLRTIPHIYGLVADLRIAPVQHIRCERV